MVRQIFRDHLADQCRSETGEVNLHVSRAAIRRIVSPDGRFIQPENK